MLNNNYIDDDSTTIILNNFAIEGMGLNYKSEILSGLLSAAIPGTGKIYAGRYEDGLFSLSIIGFYVWQAASGFRKNNTSSAKGWTYATLGAIFYLGNIYGSVVAAKIHNERIEGDFIHRLNLELKWE